MRHERSASYRPANGLVITAATATFRSGVGRRCWPSMSASSTIVTIFRTSMGYDPCSRNLLARSEPENAGHFIGGPHQRLDPTASIETRRGAGDTQCGDGVALAVPDHPCHRRDPDDEFVLVRGIALPAHAL